MREFTTISTSTIIRRGTVHHVEADQEMDRDTTELIGATVLLDGEEKTVRAMERTLIMRPIRKGEIIGCWSSRRPIPSTSWHSRPHPALHCATMREQQQRGRETDP